MKGKYRLWAAAVIIAPFVGCADRYDDLFGHAGASDAGGNAALADGGTQDCDPGASSRRCVPGQPDVEEVCHARNGDAGAWEPQPCGDGFSCLEDEGCVPCPSKCPAGAITCSPDAREVLECNPTQPSGCLDWVSVFVCPNAGLASCELPPSNATVAEIKQYCLNECGGRGIPLTAAQCDLAPTLPCAFLVCNVDTHMLEPDHSACLGGGLTCQTDSDCASCTCQSNTCIGNTKRSCSKACF